MTRRQSTRPGYTLIELVVTMGASAILMGGLASTLYMSSQALAPDESASDEDNRSSLALAQLTADLRLALSFSERTAQAVTFTVPDRNSDAQVETIRYSWTGVAAAPLLFQYNGNAAVSIADDVQRFNLSELTREIAEDSLTPLATMVIFRELTSKKASSVTTSITIDTPTEDVALDDLLMAVAIVRSSTALTLSGWNTLLPPPVAGTNVSMGVWWKRAGGSEPSSYTVTWPAAGAGRAYGWIMHFKGVDPGTPPTGAWQTESSAAPTCLAVDAAAANSMVLRIGGFDGDKVTPNAPGVNGHSPITMDKSNPINLLAPLFEPTTAASGGAAYRTLPIAGTTGTAAFNLNASRESITYTVVIAPDDGI